MLLKKKEVNPLDKKVIDNLRGLSIDTINEAKSGYPGVCLGAAPIIYNLYANHLKIDIDNPNWISRDRFVLSEGQASVLLYATLHMAGFKISLDDLKQFGRLGSITPAYPDMNLTPGVDISTGLPGEGIANAVGIALAERYLNKKLDGVVDYNTYVLCSNEDLMEGVSYEACSIAGNLGLSKLILLYDSSNITMDGKVKESFNENIKDRFKSMNWNYLLVNDAEDINSINEAILSAKDSSLPTIIEIKTSTGKYSVNEGTTEVYRGMLDDDDIENIKSKLNIRNIPFQESDEATDYFRNLIRPRNELKISNWMKKVMELNDETKNLVDLFTNFKEPVKLKDLFYDLPDSEELARETSNKIINSISLKYPFLMVGSAGISKSTLVAINDEERNLNFGSREHAMAAMANGIASVGITPVISTYLTFSDYMKPSIRMAAMMNLPVIYVFTHDSISVGRSGPVYQGVEQLVSLRAIPNIDVYRPADANEIFGSYKSILESRTPSVIVLTRNKLSVLSSTKVNEIKNGAYIVKEEKENSDIIIISSGEELKLSLDISIKLQEKGISSRVVSMPCIDKFDKTDIKYKSSVLDMKKNVFVIESSSSYSWDKFVIDRDHLFTVDDFGCSASCEDNLEKFHLNEKYIENKIEELIK